MSVLTTVGGTQPCRLHHDRNSPTVPMIAFAVPSLRYRTGAPGLRDRAGIGSSTSQRIIAISCGRLGLDQSTP
ncbi:hypothetical protein [Nonomuraea sp. NPDC049480]|uniref:hypothetical protein n=1 Tax=Nonomuraea sp. NPDC049480 TaxID=3364353 RepID=UPI003799E030